MPELESENLESGNGHEEGFVSGKEFFRIGEVSRLTSTKQFVLRYWETEFPMLQPVKSPKGHRLYRREDVQTVLEITAAALRRGFHHRRRAAPSARPKWRRRFVFHAPASQDTRCGIGAIRRRAGDGPSGFRCAPTRERDTQCRRRAGVAPARIPVGSPAGRCPAGAPAISREVLLDLRDSLRALLTLLESE